MKNIIIFIIVIIIIGISIALPSVLFKFEDFTMEKLSYKRDNIQSKIDVQAEEIYLVKAIHGQDYNMEIISESSEYETISMIKTGDNEYVNPKILTLKNELIKLKEYNIVDSTLKDNENIKIAMFDKKYSNKLMEYSLNCIEFIQNKKNRSVAIENKTGKILYIEFDKDKMLEEISREEIMRNYIKYLDLYIINDWKLEDNKLQSEKSQLAVYIMEMEERYRLGIQSLNKSSIIDKRTNIVYSVPN